MDRNWIATTAAALAAVPLTTVLAHGACTIPIGVALSTSGELSAQGQENVQMAQLAVKEANKAGGIAGCHFTAIVGNTQTTPSVGVDAVKKLIDLKNVPAIVGANSSGVTMAILTSVSVPGKVVLISPSATSPALTQLAKDGKTGGYWFRTAPSDALQGVAMAWVARNQAKLQRVAILYLNNPYGKGLSNRFAKEFRAMGGKVTADVPFNPNQPAYMSEVQQGMSGNPQALFLVGYPNTAEVIMREWIGSGGPQKYLFPDALHAPQFVDSIGGSYLNGHVWGTVPGNAKTPSLALVRAAFKQTYGHGTRESYDGASFDAAAIEILAAEAAKGKGEAVTGTAVRNMIPRVTDPKATPVYASVAGFRKAARLLKQGKPIRYIGASGDVRFNRYGDVSGPMIVWRVKDGKLHSVETLSAKRIAQIKSGS